VKIERRSGAKLASPETIFHAPAVQALLLQFAALFVVLLIAFGLEAIFNLSLSILAAALVQGVIAAVLSFWRKLASWWLAIQFLFPIVLVLVLALQLPPSLFLGAFLVFLLLYWSTFRTQVPFYPSRLSTWQAVESLLPSDGNVRFIDIGSGLGGLTLHLAGAHPARKFTGIEIAPLPWLISSLRARITGSSARFKRGDYRLLNFAEYDVVFAYLSPVAMPSLWEKASAEMRPGTLLLSYEFPIPGAPASVVVSPDDAGNDLHVWRF
jgi:SAM-dependent methyltransferase